MSATLNGSNNFREFFDNTDMPLVVSYFTDAFYQRDAFELARSCQRFALDMAIEQVRDLGSWEKNTSFKPRFLLEKHEQYPDRNLLWLDADARVRKTPFLLRKLSFDLSYYHIESPHRQALSGTVFLGNGDMRAPFLREWILKTELNPDKNDQACMELARKEMPEEFRFIELPAEYCWIFDFNGTELVDKLTTKSDPVIEHMQSSRWAKQLKKGKR